MWLFIHKLMERKKLVDIWFVFRILKFTVKIQVWLNKLRALESGRLHHVTFLSNGTFPYVCKRCCKANSKALSYGFYERVLPFCTTDAQYLCDATYNVKSRKNHSAVGKASNEPCAPDFPVHTR